MKVSVPVVPPPGDIVDTLTLFVPAVCTSAAVMVAFNCVAPLTMTNVVCLALPFHNTVEHGGKVPDTISVNG